MNSGFEFDFLVMFQSFPKLIYGARLTVLITFCGLFSGFFLGIFLGLFKISRNSFLKRVSSYYVEFIRGTPLMVQVMFVYFGLPLALNLKISSLFAGVLAIALNSSAYIAEIVRGGFQSVEKGQFEAGKSIGLTYTQTMIHVIWPQAFKRMIPPLGNQFIISLKDTSLLVVIGVGELTRTAQEIVAYNFRAFEVWLAAAFVYLSITLTLSKALNLLEKRMET